jgi:hypothetical protein
MRKGYTVRTAWECGFGDKVIVLANLPFSNEVINFPFVKFSKEEKTKTDIGMWRVKQLKK